jgi:hypothetical protein
MLLLETLSPRSIDKRMYLITSHHEHPRTFKSWVPPTFRQLVDIVGTRKTGSQKRKTIYLSYLQSLLPVKWLVGRRVLDFPRIRARITSHPNHAPKSDGGPFLCFFSKFLVCQQDKKKVLSELWTIHHQLKMLHRDNNELQVDKYATKVGQTNITGPVKILNQSRLGLVFLNSR